MYQPTDDAIAEAGERFRGNVTQHRMEILRDDGLYRHVRFMRWAPPPDGDEPRRSSSYWFELMTWPGALAVAGEMGGYLFRRTEDMFAFFRNSSYSINPSYWAEKLPGGRESVMAYSEERFKQLVIEHWIDAIRGGDKPTFGCAKAIREQILESDEITSEESARALLSQFSHGDPATARCRCGATCTESVYDGEADDWASMHTSIARCGGKVTVERPARFTFGDIWEWDLRDYTYPYLWACHAIQWGIAQYDKGAVPAAETARLPEPAGAPG